MSQAETPEAEFTVRLEQVFQGPMDLLLHLVREQEVEIHEVEIAKVIDGFLAHLKHLETFDIELAGDFVLMAATLMAIKARSLLPREEVDLEEELDPRDELIQRLIEYRRFKEASRDLGERLEERARLAAHAWHPKDEQEPTLDVSDLSQWDLLAAFSRLMRETLAHRALKITSDERPLRYYVDQLVGWVRREPEVSLRAVVREAAGGAGAEGEVDRRQLIGTFCALLELMKLGVVRAWQPHPGADIAIRVREGAGEDIEDIVRLSGLDDELEAAPAPARTLARAADDATEDSGDKRADDPAVAPPEAGGA